MKRKVNPSTGIRSSMRKDLVRSGGKWFVYDHAFNEVKAGPFDTLTAAKAAFAIIKSRGRSMKLKGARRNPEFIQTGSKKLKVTQTKTDSWSGRTMYYAGLQWWWEVSPGRFMPETYLGEKRSKRRGKLIVENSIEHGAVKIYGRCLRIEAVKMRKHVYGGKVTPATQRYFHDFTTKNAMIYGLPDGSLLIKAR